MSQTDGILSKKEMDLVISLGLTALVRETPDLMEGVFKIRSEQEVKVLIAKAKLILELARLKEGS